MHSMNQEAQDRYWLAVEAEDRRLDAVLTITRGRQDLGSLTAAEAAQERITAMEQHLAAVTALRCQHLGGAA
jgi:hypothetical protein